MTNNGTGQLRGFMGVARALADENRVRILMALQDGELCVCQIIHLLRLAPSTVSKHISILYQAGLLDSRKAGRWVYYRLPAKSDSPSVSSAIRWMRQCLAGTPGIAADGRRLRSIRAMDARELCKAYPQQCA
jgi:DNA-binding transcriptional ArsR family regulator